MSIDSKINSKQFIQQMELKKQQEAEETIQDTINKLQSQVLTSIEAKYEIAKLNTLAKDIQINTDLKNKITDALNDLEKKMPEIKELLDQKLLEQLDELQQAFTGEGVATVWDNNNPSNIFSAEQYDPYKIDGNSTLSTYL